MNEENEQYNADDEEMIAKVREREAKKKYDQDEAIRNLMASRGGRSWINHVLEFCSMFGDPHVPGQSDSTHINIGMANAGKMIWSEVEEVAPESCLLMRKEAREDEKLPSK